MITRRIIKKNIILIQRIDALFFFVFTSFNFESIKFNLVVKTIVIRISHFFFAVMDKPLSIC